MRLRNVNWASTLHFMWSTCGCTRITRAWPALLSLRIGTAFRLRFLTDSRDRWDVNYAGRIRRTSDRTSRLALLSGAGPPPNLVFSYTFLLRMAAGLGCELGTAFDLSLRHPDSGRAADDATTVRGFKCRWRPAAAPAEYHAADSEPHPTVAHYRDSEPI